MYIQLVFAVKGRQCLIHNTWEEQLYKYITGIVQNKEQKILAINGMPDHIHIFFGMKPSCQISELVREIKKSTNSFINDNKLLRFPFFWQEGYGCFTYHHSQLDRMIAYVMNQKQHHTKKTFKEEYIDLLNEFNIRFDERYLFDWIE